MSGVHDIVNEYILIHFTYQLFFSTCRNTWPTRAVVCLQWDGELYVCGHTLWIAASGVLTTMLPGRWGYDVGATKLGVFKYKVFASDSR